MASVAEKLYPPTIGSTIPAFYSENGTAEIVVPFSMNRAVSASSVKQFVLKVKTAQSNTHLKDLKSIEIGTGSFINSRIVKFLWNNIDNDNVRVGQYLKVQLAYIDQNNNTGYFSTVAVVKYTSKPAVYIEDAESDQAEGTPAFLQSYVGVYETTEDKSERPYSYNFYLYDANKELVETSGWQLHNTNVNNALTLEKTIDTYQYTTTLKQNIEYYIQYGVKTINNLEVYSQLYPCMELSDTISPLLIQLNAENVFDDGYVKLTFSKQNENDVLPVLENSVSVEISRAEVGNGPIDAESLTLYTWNVLKKFYFTDYDSILSTTFRDFTIEQGVKYLYSFRQYGSNNVFSGRSISQRVEADFEDMFLWDGKKQIKIRFNPKVSSFKANHMEQKMDTIGSRYPFIFRNGVIDYKEFPIGGLISYLTDDNELFLNHAEDLNIILGSNARRLGTPVDQDASDVEISGVGNKSWEISQTLDSVGYNMRAERRFKMKLLEWLGNGEIKLFKSAAEGNYLVRLMNISLTPEDKLGRMLHNFQATAYEMEELTYANLVSLGFINTDEIEEPYEGMASVMVKDLINNAEDLSLIKINNYPIYSYLSINLSGIQNNATPILSSGLDTPFAVTTDRLTLESPGMSFDDLYIRGEDYPSGTNKAALLSIFGDTVITYKYQSREIRVGDFLNIDKVYSKNIIASYTTPQIIDTSLHTETELDNENETYTTTETQVLKFYTINFHDKAVKDITLYDSEYYDHEVDNGQLLHNQKLSVFDRGSLYKVWTTTSTWNMMMVDDEDHLVSLTDYNGDSITINDSTNNFNSTKEIVLIDENDNVSTFNEIPTLNFDNSYYKTIKFSCHFYLDCAYQEKTTQYKPLPIS